MAAASARVNPQSRCPIFIANTTNQRWDFMWRRPGGGKAQMQPIEVGQQIRVSGQTTIADVQAIMEQWARYGMRLADEVKQLRGQFIGLILSPEKPVEVDRHIRPTIEANRGILDERGRQLRLQAGIAMQQNAEQRAQEDGGALREFEVSIVEDDPTGEGAKEKATFAENITISRQADPQKVHKTTRKVQSGQRPRRAAA